VAQEKAQTFSGRKEGSTFRYDRDKTVYVNHYYFYLDDEEFGPVFLKVCSYAPWSLKLCLNGHEWAKRQREKQGLRDFGQRLSLLGGTGEAAADL
jgi:hypothetical protein